MKKFICAIMFVLLMSAWLKADVLPTVQVRASSRANGNVLERYAVNGSGVVNSESHESFPVQKMWLAQHYLPISDAWLECDLGQICDISLMRIYNFNDKWSQIDSTENGVHNFQILLSNDGVNYQAFGGIRTANKAPGIPEDQSAPRDNRCATNFDLTGAKARFVKIDIIDSYEDPEKAIIVGLSEVVFQGQYTGKGQNIASDDITVTASSTVNGYDPVNVINGGGFITDGYGAHTWTDPSAGDGNNGWVGYFDNGQVSLTFEFDEPKDIAAVRLWNLDSWWTGQGNAAIKDFDILASTNGITFYNVLTGQLNPIANSTEYDYSQSFALSTGDVKALKLVINSAHYVNNQTSGFNEIQFIETYNIDEELHYDLPGFAQLASSWLCTPDQQYYVEKWDLIDDDVIDINDLAIFCGSWLE
ncbi:MAG: hypothetical protein JEZ07_08385 [Phycisphaerae bacterium]|nr:hypothetical protein [Phycisphaerae bacterium]